MGTKIKRANDQYGFALMEVGETFEYPRKEGISDKVYLQGASSILNYYNRKYPTKNFWRSKDIEPIIIGRDR